MGGRQNANREIPLPGTLFYSLNDFIVVHGECKKLSVDNFHID